MNQAIQIARARALQALVYAGINQFPIDVHQIASNYQVQIIPYSEYNLHLFCEQAANADGFTTWINNQQTIFLNDTKGSFERQRFILAHELGHVLLNHDFTFTCCEHDDYSNRRSSYEACADQFAKELLMPIYVLEKFNITTANNIAQMCLVPQPLAQLCQKQIRCMKNNRKYEHLYLKKLLLKSFRRQNHTFI